MSKFRLTPKIIVNGAPGCGRSTMSKFLSDEFDLVRISTGEILRKAVQDGSQLGKEAKMYMNRGELLPDETVTELVIERLQCEDCESRGWILDGYPRTLEQAENLAKAGYVCNYFVQLEAPEEILLKRIVERRLDPETGDIYNLITCPPSSSDIIDRLIHRPDDNEKCVGVQLAAYRQNQAAILDYYSSSITTFDASRSIGNICDELAFKLYKFYKYQIIFSFGDLSGLHASALAEHYSYQYLHMNSLLAMENLEEVEGKQQSLDPSIVDFAEYGSNVSSERMIAAIELAMTRSNSRKFIIEGFPRNLDNYNTFIASLGKKCALEFAIYFNILDISQANQQLYLAAVEPVLIHLDVAGKLRIVEAGFSSSLTYAGASQLFIGLNLLEPFSRTLAIIKPDALVAGKIPDIIANIKEAKLSVTRGMFVRMNLECLQGFYPQHVDSDSFDLFREYMCSAPCYVMVLEGRLAWKRWQVLLTDLKHVYGNDGMKNALHGSDSEVSTYHEINFWFNQGYPGFRASIEDPMLSISDPKPLTKKAIRELKSASFAGPNIKRDTKKATWGKEDVLSLVQPEFSHLHIDDLMSILKVHGFEIVGELKRTFTLKDLEMVNVLNPRLVGSQVTYIYSLSTISSKHIALSIQKYDNKNKIDKIRCFKNNFLSSSNFAFFYVLFDNSLSLYLTKHYTKMGEYMTSSPIVALHLRRQGAVNSLRFLLGPENVHVARVERPDSIRALLAINEMKIVMFSSATVREAVTGLEWLFRCTEEGAKSKNDSAAVIDIDVSKRENCTAVGIHPKPLVSSEEKKRMLHYVQNDINHELTGFITRTITTRPADFFEFGIKDFTEQKALANTSLSPSSAGGVKKLAPIKSPPKIIASETTTFDEAPATSQQLTPSLTAPESRHHKHTSDLRVVEPSSPPKTSLLVNRSLEIFNDLEEAKAEIVRLKHAITQISLNIRD